jgi:BMFP domain-containing protein YqiC
MKNVQFVSGRSVSRRAFLRGAGVAMALPLLDAMAPAVVRAASSGKEPRRMLAVCNNLGLLPENFFPETAGRNYKPSAYLELLKDHRNDFTVFSGVWHPDVDGGHPADNCFLTAAPHPGSGGFRNTISLDQYAAQQLGNVTRFPSLTLGVNVSRGQRSLSWTAGGAMIPCEEKASDVFKRLFLTGSREEVERQVRRLELGQSIMDAVSGQAKDLERGLGARDRDRLDQYFTGVRDLEVRMGEAKEWEHKPKPKVDAKVPVDPQSPKQYMAKVKLMYDMAELAFETDSTRMITLLLDSVNSPAIDVEGHDINDGYHSLSHHGKSAAKMAQLDAIDREHMRLLGELYAHLKARREVGASLFDRTMVLYGSNLGNANTHVTTNLPILLAGGGFKHGQHLAFDRERNYPLPNLFVSMMQRMGLETDRFATSTGTMRGLDLA